jgi:Skp family chaperone for outer membrane proteins
MKLLIGSVGVVALVALGGVGWLAFGKKEKLAFVYNQQVFDKFEGTLELKEKLGQQQQAYKAILDSLSVLVQSGRKDLQPVYENRARELSLKHKEVLDRYTADIWTRINQEILIFGKDQGYDFVFGASGNGSLMYAADQKNVTAEFVEYLNGKYKGGR